MPAYADELGEALIRASESGQREMIPRLLAAGAPVNRRVKFGCRTPRKASASEGHLEVVKLLVAAGSDLTRIIHEPSSRNVADARWMART
ncbi:MAG: hypothetical protein JSV80_08505 [Acidobacteriota bacterium]|nr:MAG: hypothetical protein JSV80_08505 [Acidobacteriota bacterium]